MLAARSPVFDAQLFGTTMDGNDTTQHIQVDDMEPAIFEMLLHFFYTDSLPPPCDREAYSAATMKDLLVAADRYKLDRLKVMCEEKLCKSINVDNVAGHWRLANQYSCWGLKNACVVFMSAP
jgi:speckle-type POZ protein